MKNYFKKFIILISLIAILALPYIVFAASPAYDNLKKVGSGDANAPYVEINNANSLAGIVGIVIQAFLGLLGILFLVYMLYAGYNWMTAQGDEEKVTKAKDTISRAVIGLIVTIAAYAISLWVIDKIITGKGIFR